MTNSYTLSILWVPGCGWVWKKDMFFCVGKSILKFLKLLYHPLWTVSANRNLQNRTSTASAAPYPIRHALRPTPRRRTRRRSSSPSCSAGGSCGPSGSPSGLSRSDTVRGWSSACSDAPELERRLPLFGANVKLKAIYV